MDTTFLTVSQHKLYLPSGVKDQAMYFVQRQASEGARSVENAPFRRIVDFWIMSIVVAISKALPPGRCDGEAFVAVGPTSRDVKLDSSVKELLVLVAIWHLRPTRESVPSATAVLEVCNRFAAAGAPHLLAQLKADAYGDNEFLPPTTRLAKVVKDLLGETARIGA